LAQTFDPNSEAALFATASLHYGRREFEQAERLCVRILNADPRHQKALFLVGMVALAKGRPPLAKECFARAIAVEPNVDLLLDVADALEQADDLDGARQRCQEAVALQPLNARAQYKLGLMLHWMKNSAGAIVRLREAVRLDPEMKEARIDLGRALLGAGEYREARNALEPALALRPPSPSALVFHGLACHELGDFSAAIESLEKAIKLERNPVYTLCNLANIHRDAGDFNRAAEHYERALALAPGNMDTRNDYAHGLLAMGQFERGWEMYEARWESGDRTARQTYRQPAWNGEPLEGKRLLVWGEQGIGDQMMFAGLLPEVLAQGASCSAVVEPKLARLFERSFPAITVVARKSEAHAALLNAPFDFQVPIASLGRHFRRSWADFPQHAGYLHADPAKVEAWKARLAALGPGKKVAISWRGGFVGTRRHMRSMDLEAWLPILKTPGLEFISLQYTDCAAEIEALRQKHGVVLHHWQEAIDDYDETAALVCAVDRVVSVCTALVHLAGALGRPAWVLVPAVPEWRYMREGERMPWYPSVTLLRQPRVWEWEGVVGQVAGLLRQ